MREAMTPAPESKLEQALAAMSVLVAPRRGDEDSADLMLAVYSRKLQEYPADVALYVINSWPETEGGKFWPTWAELKPKLDAWNRGRSEMLAALEYEAKHAGAA